MLLTLDWLELESARLLELDETLLGELKLLGLELVEMQELDEVLELEVLVEMLELELLELVLELEVLELDEEL